MTATTMGKRFGPGQLASLMHSLSLWAGPRGHSNKGCPAVCGHAVLGDQRAAVGYAACRADNHRMGLLGSLNSSRKFMPEP